MTVYKQIVNSVHWVIISSAHFFLFSLYESDKMVYNILYLKKEALPVNCMKCGVEVPETQVFCDHCLQVMEKYPVKPDTHVHLPKRSVSVDPAKKPSKKKRAPTQEEVLSSLRLRVLRLRLAVVVLIFLVCVLGGMLGLNLYQQYTQPVTGRNYTIDTTR